MLPHSRCSQCDVPAAFLRSQLDKKVCMEPAPGMQVPPGHVLLLTRAVHGLVQSPRLFYREFAKCLESIGFKRCVLDGCLFVRTKNGKRQLMALHVDDGLLATNDSCLQKEVQQALKDEDVDEFNPMGHHLGFQLKQCRRPQHGDIFCSKLHRDPLRALPHAGREAGSNLDVSRSPASC